MRLTSLWRRSGSSTIAPGLRCCKRWYRWQLRWNTGSAETSTEPALWLCERYNTCETCTVRESWTGMEIKHLQKSLFRFKSALLLRIFGYSLNGTLREPRQRFNRPRTTDQHPPEWAPGFLISRRSIAMNFLGILGNNPVPGAAFLLQGLERMVPPGKTTRNPQKWKATGQNKSFHITGLP